MRALEESLKRKRAPTDPIERINRKSDVVFIREHLCPSDSRWTEWIDPKTQSKLTLGLVGAKHISEQDLKACFGLIEETSRSQYEPSSFGWKPSKKLAEMKSSDLRYILLKDSSGSVRGFTSLMLTYEEGEPVVYCYEIHLKPELQGTGLGKKLISFAESVAAHSRPIEKVMLTCFLSNARALAFYARLGFKKDEISPEPRKLRFGKEFVPDYVIMSKAVRRATSPSPRSPYLSNIPVG